ncbi:MAG TPA: hypothetical protein DCF99_05975 [Flavobacteriaceae bacterium]|nr:hypothetical protein [Flavobacteriaceae bacterium]
MKPSKLYSTFLVKDKKLVKGRKNNARISVISDIQKNTHFCVIEVEDGKNASAQGDSVLSAFMRMLTLFNEKYAA